MLSAAELELVDVELVEMPPSPAEVDEALVVEPLDPEVAVVTPDPPPLENPVEATPPPPQPAVPKRTIAARAARMSLSV